MFCQWKERMTAYILWQSVKHRMSQADYICKLLSYDMISFDLFDTLLLREVEKPTDLFYHLEKEMQWEGGHDLRIRCEREIRQIKKKRYGSYEVTLDEIWTHIEKNCGIEKEKGVETEIALEKRFSKGNSFFYPVWEALSDAGKEVYVISDMYLPKDVLSEMLSVGGFLGIQDIFVSCAYGCSKAEGSLYDVYRSSFSPCNMIHVGDHPISDGIRARQHGMEIMYYPRAFVS